MSHSTISEIESDEVRKINEMILKKTYEDLLKLIPVVDTYSKALSRFNQNVEEWIKERKEELSKQK